MDSPIRRYGVAPPTEDDALTMLARLLGVDAAAREWLRARRDAGVGSDVALALTPEQLLRVAERLLLSPGPERAAGASLAIRARTWLLLNRDHASPAR